MRALIAIAGLGLLVGGCGGHHSRDVAGDTVIGGDEACGKKPAFVPLYADAKVILCSASHDDAARKDSGTIIYTAAAAPGIVLAWSKEQVLKAGLTEQLSTPETFSASEGDRRTAMILAAAQGTGSQVTINWSRVR